MGKREAFALAVPAGASAEAIQFHYDIGTDFFRTWLGEDLVYSAARWSEPLGNRPPLATLEHAQIAKLDFHLNAIRAGEGKRILDIGCGWGSLLRRAVDIFDVAEAIGVTLSSEQYEYVHGLGLPRMDLYLESYETLSLPEAVDGIVSIGAFEHFVRPGLDRGAKVLIYRRFFQRCHSLLRAGGRFSLQTIFWQAVERDRAHDIVPSDVFPESDLPYLDEIFDASRRFFRALHVETSEDDYVRTLQEWLRRLRQARVSAPHIVDAARFAFHEDYLRRCIVGFRRHRISLSRVVFERL